MKQTWDGLCAIAHEEWLLHNMCYAYYHGHYEDREEALATALYAAMSELKLLRAEIRNAQSFTPRVYYLSHTGDAYVRSACGLPPAPQPESHGTDGSLRGGPESAL